MGSFNSNSVRFAINAPAVSVARSVSNITEQLSNPLLLSGSTQASTAFSIPRQHDPIATR